MQDIALGPAIPGLIVADRAQPPSELLDPLAPGVEVCHDARGDLLAYCRAGSGTLRVDLPDLASFSYERGAGHVRAIPHRPLSPGFILDTYHHCVLPLILPALGTEVLHASAVVGARGVAAFCGVSGTGKSTLAVALARRGYAIWADDAVAVDIAEPEPAAVPRVTLAHAYCFSVNDPAQKRRTISNYLTLAGRVPAYEIRFRPGLEHLPAVLDAIEAIVGRAATGPR